MEVDLRSLLSDVVYWAKRSTEVLENQQKEVREQFRNLGKDLEEVKDEALSHVAELKLDVESLAKSSGDYKAALEIARKVLDDIRRRLWDFQKATGPSESLLGVRKLVDYAREAVYVQLGGLAWEPRTDDDAPEKLRDKDDTGVHIVIGGHDVGRVSLKRILIAGKWAFHAGFITTGAAWVIKHIVELVGGG